MATKLDDMIVAVSKYTDQNGQEKRRWENIGSIWQDTDSNGNTYKFAWIKRTFNPAGVETPDGSDSIRVTLAPPKPQAQAQQSQQQQPAWQQQQQQQRPQSSQQAWQSQPQPQQAWQQQQGFLPPNNSDGFGENVNDMPF